MEFFYSNEEWFVYGQQVSIVEEFLNVLQFNTKYHKPLLDIVTP